MTAIPDLAPCTEVMDSPDVIAVGWLGAEEPYATGAVAADVFLKLMQLLVEPWNPYVAMGIHSCELCRFSGGPGTVSYNTGPGRQMDVRIGHRNLFVPVAAKLYVAPSSIVHYIDSHQYAPPAQFCEAVMACPPMGSMEYKRALLKSSPPFVAKFVKRAQ